MAARAPLALCSPLESPDRHEGRTPCLRIRVKAFRTHGSRSYANWIRRCTRKFGWIVWVGVQIRRKKTTCQCRTVLDLRPVTLRPLRPICTIIFTFREHCEVMTSWALVRLCGRLIQNQFSRKVSSATVSLQKARHLLGRRSSKSPG